VFAVTNPDLVAKTAQLVDASAATGRMRRIARTLRIPAGTAEIQRRTIARQLLPGDTIC
jgi:alkylation response protein AidB-like acyl-CoA dehydrogenase